MSAKNPYTILDAEFYLYTDADAAEVYFGGCVDSATFDLAYTARRLEFHGLPAARDHHDDEEHTIDLRNVWLHDRSGGVSRMPGGFERNVRYFLVVIWRDVEIGIWTKRTYEGVTSRGQHQEDSFEDLRFRAETLDERAGVLADGEPSVLPDLIAQRGFVRYVSASERLILYTYDGPTETLAVVDDSLLAGRAMIAIDDAGAEITFNGVRALFATDEETQVGTLIAKGSSILDEVPRLEFHFGGARVAALGASGALVAVNLQESGEPDGLSFKLNDADGDWLFSLALPKSSFPLLTEVPP